MALGSLAEGTRVTVIPVGMNYFHAHKFRSRAVVKFGDPVEISSDLVNNFKSGKRRESVGALLGSIYQSLAAVTVTAPDFETMMVTTSLAYLSSVANLVACSCRETIVYLEKETTPAIHRH
jgi:glycerol-3-phosphate O-acyltransferase/dihydroxyacetone phosphate acyltransferase